MFKHRSPSLKVRKAMSVAAVGLGKDYTSSKDAGATKELAAKVSRMTGKAHVRPVSSGNGAIFAALFVAPGPVMLPDTGGWIAFRTHPKVLGLETHALETDAGYIDLDLLKKNLDMKAPKTLLYSASSGFLAENDGRHIAELCRDKGVRTIEDITGVLGRKDAGRHADVVVCSTGPATVANLLSGGFIAADSEELLEASQFALSLAAPDPVTIAGMVAALDEAPRTYQDLVETADQFKRDLEGYDQLVHPRRRGISIGLDLSEGVLSPEWVYKRSLELGLLTELRSPLLLKGPRYDRLDVPSVTIELKKVDIAYYEREALIGRLVEAVDALLRPQASVAQLVRAADS